MAGSGKTAELAAQRVHDLTTMAQWILDTAWIDGTLSKPYSLGPVQPHDVAPSSSDAHTENKSHIRSKSWEEGPRLESS